MAVIVYPKYMGQYIFSFCWIFPLPWPRL